MMVPAVAIGVTGGWFALTARRFVVARRRRPAILSEIKEHLSSLVSFAETMDDLVHRFPSWRNDVNLAVQANSMLYVFSDIASQLSRLAFGSPLKAMDRLDALLDCLCEAVADFEERAWDRFGKPSLT